MGWLHCVNKLLLISSGGVTRGRHHSYLTDSTSGTEDSWITRQSIVRDESWSSFPPSRRTGVVNVPALTILEDVGVMGERLEVGRCEECTKRRPSFGN